MQNKIVTNINKSLRKQGVKLKIEKSDSLIGFYDGFNNFFAEFIKFRLEIKNEKYVLELNIKFQFEHLKNIEQLIKAKVSLSKDGSINFIIEKDSIDNIINDINYLFSKEIRVYYHRLLIQEYKNKNA